MATTGAAPKYSVSRFNGKCVDYSVVLLESTRSHFYSPYSVNVTVTNELLEVYKTLISAKTLCFMTFFSLFCQCYQYKKGDMLYIFQMWIHYYIDMITHKSKHIEVYIFRMWIHRYIDMYPHCLDNSFLVFNVFYSQLIVYRDISTFASHGIKYVNVSTLPSLLTDESTLSGHK